MADGIDFYLHVLKRISDLYDGNEDELIISEKLEEFMRELRKAHEEPLVKRALRFVLEVFEKYYYDEFNTINVSSGPNIQTVSAQDRDILTQALAQELFRDDYPASNMITLNKMSAKDKEILIDILKKELNS